MSVPQVTVKSETIDPRVMRRFEASMAGQLSTTVPLVGITASIRVDGAKLEVDVEDEVAEPEVAVAVTVTVDVAVGVVAVCFDFCTAIPAPTPVPRPIASATTIAATTRKNSLGATPHI